MDFLTASKADYPTLRAGKNANEHFCKWKAPRSQHVLHFPLVFPRKTTKEIKLHLTLSRDIQLVLSFTKAFTRTFDSQFPGLTQAGIFGCAGSSLLRISAAPQSSASDRALKNSHQKKKRAKWKWSLAPPPFLGVVLLPAPGALGLQENNPLRDKITPAWSQLELLVCCLGRAGKLPCLVTISHKTLTLNSYLLS